MGTSRHTSGGLSGIPMAGGGGFAGKALHTYGTNQRKVGRHERDFNISISRARNSENELRQMVLGSIKPSQESGMQYQGGASVSKTNQHMRVRARNIPRQLPALNDTYKPKRTDLLNRSDESMDHRRARTNSIDRCNTVPPLGSNKIQGKENYKLNFVSASDLHDILNQDEGQGVRGQRPPKRVWNLQSPKTGESNLFQSPRKGNAQQSPRIVSFAVNKPNVAAERVNDPPSANLQVPKSEEASDFTFSSSRRYTNMSESKRKAREEHTKILLKEAIDKLKDIESRLLGQPSVKTKLKKSKKLTLPKVSLDAIPEVEREETSASLRLHDIRSVSAQRQATLDAILEGNKDISSRTDYATLQDSMTLNMKNYRALPSIKSSASLTNEETLDSQSFPLYTSQQYWNTNAAHSTGDSYRSKKLQYQMKQRTKVKKIKFLKAS